MTDWKYTEAEMLERVRKRARKIRFRRHFFMTKEQLAALLNGREYGDEITKDEENMALVLGLVVIFGAGDDLIEFRGKWHDEIGCSNGYELAVNKSGPVLEPDDDEREVLKKFGVLDVIAKGGRKIKAIWSRDPYSWQYETDIPHAMFDVLEGDEKYCRGIVFAVSDL